MSKKFSMKTVDEFLFKQIDQLKKLPQYQKLEDQVSSLGETQLKIIQYSLNAFVTLIPLTLISIMIVFNWFNQSSLSLKKDILIQIKEYQSNQKDLNDASQKILSQGEITEEGDAKSKVQSLAGLKNIDAQKLSVTEFEQVHTGFLNKSQFTTKFKDLTLPDFIHFLTGMLNNERMKIDSLNIEKNKKNFLDGFIQATHFGKGK